MYRYTADGGGVAECVIRRRRPVAEAEDSPAFDAH
jgi:hypothetical protein